MDELEDTEQQSLGTEEVDLTDQASVSDNGDSAETAAPSLPEIEIERNGQVIKVPFDQAKDYVSKGYDYTQKTQELARERESLNPYRELATAFQANPELARKTYELWQNGGQDVDPVQQKVAHLEMMTNQLIQQNSQEKMNNMLATIHNDEKYNGLFKDKDMEDLLLASALQTKNTHFDGLKATADKIHSKWFKAQVESEKKGEQKVIKNLASPTRKSESGKGTYTPPKDFNPAKAGWKDLNQRAIEML